MFTLGKTPSKRAAATVVTPKATTTTMTMSVATPGRLQFTSPWILASALPAKFAAELQQAKTAPLRGVRPTARITADSAMALATLGRNLYGWKASSSGGQAAQQQQQVVVEIPLPCDDDHDEHDGDLSVSLPSVHMACVSYGRAFACSPGGKVRLWHNYRDAPRAFIEAFLAQARGTVSVVPVPGDADCDPGFVVLTAQGSAILVYSATRSGKMAWEPMPADEQQQQQPGGGSFLTSWIPWGGAKGRRSGAREIRAVRGGLRSGDVFAITDSSLVRWSVSPDHKPRMVYAVDLAEIIRESISRAVAERSDVTVTLFDLFVTNSGSVFVAASSRPTQLPPGRSALVFYHVAKV
jgi:hypothetical protein